MRTCNLERARAAAVDALTGIERVSERAKPNASQSTIPPDVVRVLLMGALAKCSNAAALKWGAAWSMTEEEARHVAEPLVEIVETWTGSLGEDPYSRLLCALGVYALPRVVALAMGVDLSTALVVVDDDDNAPKGPRNVESETVEPKANA